MERRQAIIDHDAAQWMVQRERERLRTALGYLHERAEQYATLGQFCAIHRQRRATINELARLSARHLIGHGFHKDVVLFDVIDASRFLGTSDRRSGGRALSDISPIVQVIDEITDGDETRHLKAELAEALGDVAPEALPTYLRVLQRRNDHWEVEASLTHLARTADLSEPYMDAVAGTLVHDSALIALSERAQAGDVVAAGAVTRLLSHYGRSLPPAENGRNAGHSPVEQPRAVPTPADFPPERIGDFIDAVREARVYDDSLLATWTLYWRDRAPDALLATLTAWRNRRGRPHETRTAARVVALAMEREGRAAAWDWLVAYHNAVHGWNWHLYPLDDTEWIWAIIRDRYPDRWLEFVADTARPEWRSLGGAPSWSVSRMARYLAVLGDHARTKAVVEAGVRWGAGLAANMQLPAAAFDSEARDEARGLALLVDRLDCPSRMVQERAGVALAQLLASTEAQDATAEALSQWHDREPNEARSCLLLTIVQLATAAHGAPHSVAVGVARRAALCPSVAAAALVGHWGSEGAGLAYCCEYRDRHSGAVRETFIEVPDFRKIVSEYLAPVFLRWAERLPIAGGVSFLRQWQWEASELAKVAGLALSAHVASGHHHRGGGDRPPLAFADRLSAVLRSAYLRALHWLVDVGAIESDTASIHGCRVGVMADPAMWRTLPASRPPWWPVQSRDAEPDMAALARVVDRALRAQCRPDWDVAGDIVAYAAGPIYQSAEVCIELRVQAFLQAAVGPLQPYPGELADTPTVACKPVPLRASVPGAYLAVSACAGPVGDWLVAPLSWWLQSDTHNWLLPERQARQTFVPPEWLVVGTPTIDTTSDALVVRVGDRTVAQYHYWHDGVAERHHLGALPRCGGQLLLRCEWLAKHRAAGASLCWTASLVVARRGRYKDVFDEATVARSWIIGGSRIVWNEPWLPP